MASWTNQSKNTASWSNQSKNAASWVSYLRHGKEPTMAQLADYTFQSVVFEDGTTLESVTFADLADQVWTNQTKNN